MRILFDNGTPAPLLRFLPEHIVTIAAEIGWERLRNGDLLRAAEENGYDLLLTTDKRIRYQQNLKGRRIALVVLGNQQWPVARMYVAEIRAAVSSATPGSYQEVAIPFRLARGEPGA